MSLGSLGDVEAGASGKENRKCKGPAAGVAAAEQARRAAHVREVVRGRGPGRASTLSEMEPCRVLNRGRTRPVSLWL